MNNRTAHNSQNLQGTFWSSESYPTCYRYGFNGMEKDDEVKGNGNSLDFGARIYDARIGRWLSLDPMAKEYPSLSDYSYTANNPILFIDVGGKWLGVTIFFFEGEIGAGLGYGLNYIEQTGVAYDDVGQTQFVMSNAVYLVNQNLEEGSRDPQVVIGLSGGLSGGITQNWSNDTFYEMIGGESSTKFPTGSAKVKGKLFIGASLGADEFSLSLGVQAGIKISRLSMQVKESVSLTDDEADIVNDATDVILESWMVTNATYNSNTDKWEATVGTMGTNGEFIDTGVKIYSDNEVVENDEGKKENKSTGIWMSADYKEELNES